MDWAYLFAPSDDLGLTDEVINGTREKQMSFTFAITETDITNVAPEFAGIAEERLQFFIELAESYICESRFGTKAKHAVILYIAHLLTMSARGASGNVGAVTSEKVGELSRNYGQIGSGISDEAGELAQTPYGMMFHTLRKGILKTPIIVG